MIRLSAIAVAGLCFAANTAFSQPQPNPGGDSLRGRVVRVEGQDRIVVQTPQNKEVILMSTPNTRYMINGKVGRFTDIRNGINLNATYNLQDNRYIVSSVQVGDEPGPAAGPNAAPANDRRFRGRIVRVDVPNGKITARTQDGREVILFVTKNAHFMQNGQALALNNVPVGAIIETAYVERDNHWWVEEVTILPENAAQPPQEPVPQPAPQPAPPPAPPAQAAPTQIQGTIVRVVGQNQIIVRTADNREVIVDVQPQTVYSINDQPSQLNAFQPGAPVQVYYNVHERRNLASRILGRRQ